MVRPLVVTEDMEALGDPSHHADRPKGEAQLSVKAFGAKGDGVTDDTAAIQRTIEVAHNMRGATNPEPTVFFPPGFYLTSNLTVYNGTHLDGCWYDSTILMAAPGTVGFLIEDDDSAARTSITNLGIDLNGENCSGIKLGYGTTEWGAHGKLLNLYIKNGVYGAILKDNVGYIFQVACFNLSEAAIKLDGGGGSFVGQLSCSTCAKKGLWVNSDNTHVNGVHLEGAFSEAGIYVGENGGKSGNNIASVYCFVGNGLTTNCVVYFKDNCRNNLCSHIVASEIGTLTNGVIFDQSMAMDRKVLGLKYVDFYTVESYWSETGYWAYEGDVAPPTTGAHIKGDGRWNGNPAAGHPAGWVCSGSGAPGTWSPLPPIAAAVAKDADYTILPADNGNRFSNAGAVAAVDIELPPVAVNLEYEFIKTTAQAFTITPQAGEQINAAGAGVALTLANVGDCVRLGYEAAGLWRTIRDNR